MRAFEHYASRPQGALAAEQALRAWRLEALRLERRRQSGCGTDQAVAAAKREIAAARDFLAPPSIVLSPSTLRHAVKKLQSAQSMAEASLEASLAGNDAAAKAARMLVWHAPGNAPEPAGDRARRLRLSTGSAAGGAALGHAIAYGGDLLARSARVTSR